MVGKGLNTSFRPHAQGFPFQCVSYKTAIALLRPRTHWYPVMFATSINIGAVETETFMTWHWGDIVAKACNT